MVHLVDVLVGKDFSTIMHLCLWMDLCLHVSLPCVHSIMLSGLTAMKLCIESRSKTKQPTSKKA